MYSEGHWSTEQNTVEDYVKKINTGHYNANPEHQRNVVHSNLWKSKIIESIIEVGDIPPVYYHKVQDKDFNITWDSLDGKQRSMALVEFLYNEYKYEAEQDDMKNKYFRDIPIKIKNYLSNFQITVTKFNGTMDEEGIAKFFENRQNCKVTKPGEFINSKIHCSLVVDFLKPVYTDLSSLLGRYRPDDGRYNNLYLLTKLYYIWFHERKGKQFFNLVPQNKVLYMMLEDKEIESPNEFKSSLRHLIDIWMCKSKELSNTCTILLGVYAAVLKTNRDFNSQEEQKNRVVAALNEITFEKVNGNHSSANNHCKIIMNALRV